MSDNVSIPVAIFDYEHVTDHILREARRRASVAKRGTDIVITHEYECPAMHDETIRMLLTGKARTTSTPLHYRNTYRGKHTFRVP
ncbi:MAG: hypothetical protein JWO55_190 [Candidatus Saccharibacteria bacterium]|nr:hypothetical protein [Candidatus Saccharibacteria bacterium]